MNWHAIGKWLRREIFHGPYERLDQWDSPSWRKRCKEFWVNEWSPDFGPNRCPYCDTRIPVGWRLEDNTVLVYRTAMHLPLGKVCPHTGGKDVHPYDPFACPPVIDMDCVLTLWRR